MYYPKVLERVDSPEQIFHRSFSLGAPDVHQTDSGHFKVDFQIPSRFDVTPSSFPTQEGNQKEFSQGLFQRSTLIYR